MKNVSSLTGILAGFASLLILVCLFTPIWKIDLSAPQYPEGVSMQIWSSKLSGNIETVNILNHYIGMSPIQQENFPEFKFLNFVLLGLSLFGLLSAIAAKKLPALLYVWAVSLMVFVVAGLYDFWKWGYEYGHRLNPDAPMKLEGMNYQPPLIGTKSILNIDASSYPDIGGIAFGLALLLAIIACILRVRESRKNAQNPTL
jgi:copper chaperone NosL